MIWNKYEIKARYEEKKKVLIKICGMRTRKDISYANAYRPDLIGCVLFFPKSKRNISLKTAKLLLEDLSADIPAVAVTVSPTLDQLHQIEAIGFDYIQIHGSLSDQVYEAASIPILRAFNVTDLEEYRQIREKNKIVGYVFDAKSPGSGQTFDWNLLKEFDRDHKLWFLAGGINESNVLDAIRQVRPDGIDVSSAVEWTFSGDDRSDAERTNTDNACSAEERTDTGHVCSRVRRIEKPGACLGKDPLKMKNIIRMVHDAE